MSSFGLNGGPMPMLGGRVLFEIIITSFVAVQCDVEWSDVNCLCYDSCSGAGIGNHCHRLSPVWSQL